MQKGNPEQPHLMLLVKHKLISPRASATDVWAMWQRVCEDSVVVERSKKKAAAKRPAYLASFASGYSHAEFVLKQMNAKDLQALRNRLGVRPMKEFAVVVP
jgi:hypothetical protein